MISMVKIQVTDVKNVMMQNTDVILEREERLSIFLNRIDDPPNNCQRITKHKIDS